ncbi:Sensor protein CitS [[Clostridium] ultunense Esp]|nr:Sensor protein CitS [[Clostridium] ultunense Esp]
MRLQTRMILLIMFVIFIVVLLMGVLFQTMLAETIKEQIGMRALRVAQTIAKIPEIREAYDDPDPSRVIQPIAESIRKEIGAEFVVIGNREGIRYSHPVKDRIGHGMVGGDNGPVFEGKSIISEAVGTLGPSIRGKTPVFNEKGEVIGVVSVGFLIDDVNAMAYEYGRKILFTGLVALFLGIVGALITAKSVKKAIFGLEPKEIAALYQEKKAIMEAIKEGIIAVNQEGRITLANQTALRLLHKEEGTDLTGMHITEVIPQSRLPEVIRNGEAEYDREMEMAGNLVIVNRIPIIGKEGEIIGAVSSFREKSELYRLTQELSQIKRYAEGLRAQTHEYSNKLHLISGLLQMGQIQEAIEVLTKEVDVQQDFIHFIMRQIRDPILGGLLIGKYNGAREKKIDFIIEPDSSFRDVPEEIDRDHLLTILGNLIDNAFEAVLENQDKPKRVLLSLTDLGNDLIMEVEDNGPGIPEARYEEIFKEGFSTKEGFRGIGLYLVKRAVELHHGYIQVGKGESGGARFTVVLPKKEIHR